MKVHVSEAQLVNSGFLMNKILINTGIWIFLDDILFLASKLSLFDNKILFLSGDHNSPHILFLHSVKTVHPFHAIGFAFSRLCISLTPI